MTRRLLLLVAAVVLTLAGLGTVFAYANGADTRASHRYSLGSAMVVSAKIPAGATPEQVAKVSSLKRLPVLAIPSGAVLDLASVKGKVLAEDVLPGQVLQNALFVLPASRLGGGGDRPLAIPAGQLAMSVQLSDKERVARFVRPGDYVAVYATSHSEPITTRLLLRRVLVLAVGPGGIAGQQPVVDTVATSQGATANTSPVVGTEVVTLGVTIVQGVELAHASETGAVTLALESTGSVTAGEPSVRANAQVFAGRP